MAGNDPRRLTVVLGAGASFDCVAEGAAVTATDEEFKPPLAKGIFEFRPSFNGILRGYPKVEALSEEIRVRVGKGENLEQILLEMSEVSEFQMRKEVLEVPLYLQELFWTISDKYVMAGGTKFHTLVRRVLRSGFHEVMFLTLNYDLLLERALSVCTDNHFSSASSYRSADRRWSVMKLHGSVNWVRSILNGPKWDGDPNNFLSRFSEEPEFSPDITVLANVKGERNFSIADRMRDDRYLYPSLAIPVSGPKQFACPAEHLEMTREFLNKSQHFLFIGFSGQDPHVLELFKDVSRVHSLMFVCGSRQFASEAYGKLFTLNQKILPTQHFQNEEVCLSDLGFAGFVESDEFTRFLALN